MVLLLWVWFVVDTVRLFVLVLVSLVLVLLRLVLLVVLVLLWLVLLVVLVFLVLVLVLSVVGVVGVGVGVVVVGGGGVGVVVVVVVVVAAAAVVVSLLVLSHCFVVACVDGDVAMVMLMTTTYLDDNCFEGFPVIGVFFVPRLWLSGALAAIPGDRRPGSERKPFRRGQKALQEG